MVNYSPNKRRHRKIHRPRTGCYTPQPSPFQTHWDKRRGKWNVTTSRQHICIDEYRQKTVYLARCSVISVHKNRDRKIMCDIHKWAVSKRKKTKKLLLKRYGYTVRGIHPNSAHPLSAPNYPHFLNRNFSKTLSLTWPVYVHNISPQHKIKLNCKIKWFVKGREKRPQQRQATPRHATSINQSITWECV